MWILAVINALGLVSGAFINQTVMYVLFGISFIAFFHKYALIAWRFFYENHVEREGRMDMMLANEFVCFFSLACIYWLVVDKAGSLCVAVSALQCAVFQAFHLAKRDSKKDIVVIVLFIVEFLVAIVYTL